MATTTSSGFFPLHHQPELLHPISRQCLGRQGPWVKSLSWEVMDNFCSVPGCLKIIPPGCRNPRPDFCSFISLLILLYSNIVLAGNKGAGGSPGLWLLHAHLLLSGSVSFLHTCSPVRARPHQGCLVAAGLAESRTRRWDKAELEGAMMRAKEESWCAGTW